MISPVPKKVLVLRPGSFGEMVHSLRALQALRQRHKEDEITLFASSEALPLALAANVPDHALLDEAIPFWRPDRHFALRNHVKKAGFSKVYDLSGKKDLDGLLSALGPDCDVHRVQSSDDTSLHQIEQEEAFLEKLGIRADAPDFSGFSADLTRLSLPEQFALLLPGGGIEGHPETRGPGHLFGKIAQALAAKGVIPIIVGSESEAEIVNFVHKRCLKSRKQLGDLAPQELASLARIATLAVGNDSGILDYFAAVGAPTLSLATPLKNPARFGPRGPNVKIIQADDLHGLSLGDVLAQLPIALKPALEGTGT